MGIPDLLTSLLRCQQSRSNSQKWTWNNRFQIGKGVPQVCILSLCLYNLYAEYIMWNARLDESQAGIKIAGRNINTAGKDWKHKEAGQRMRCLDSITDSTDMNLQKLWERVNDRGAWHPAVHGFADSRSRLRGWTATINSLTVKLHWVLSVSSKIQDRLI